ncbi:hypothetical protein NDU88_001586 [Pleurodeles waltl]|uniref:Uncharacterized protein n=1 Tax=Pleurodeles waltl TaxID=8319 RepID=A0AAV7T0E4_PLEWA|nr:hypothetical protein NDU88_001586 [Pleurodeles waltl]
MLSHIRGGSLTAARPPCILLLRWSAAEPEAAASPRPRPSQQARSQGLPQSRPNSPRPPRRSHGEAERGDPTAVPTSRRPREGRLTSRSTAPGASCFLESSS